MTSFEAEKELQFKKNVLGVLLTICGSSTIVIAAVLDYGGRNSSTVFIGLALGIIMIIAGFFLGELLIKGASLIFFGIQMILFDQLFILIDRSIMDNWSLLLRIGVPALIIGIILFIFGYRE